MNDEEKIKMFNDVFAPKSGEKILFLVDTPHNSIKDNQKWKDRREMAREWYKTFRDMGENKGFTVAFKEFRATGVHNSPVPQEILNIAGQANLVIAMTEFSGSSSFVPMCQKKDSKIRAASMPLVEKRMEDTAFKADYSKVQRYSIALEKLLNKAIGAEVLFSTGDALYIDLRNRKSLPDKGECNKRGQFINFPSGETGISPYEAVMDEVDEFGSSKTKGILPVDYDGELVKFVVDNNRITEIIGNGKNAEKMRGFFAENETRKNIAELGIGCNPNAVVTGNELEDEKAGLHIAYGMSTHLGGKIKSDTHIDICYPKGCPIEGITVLLINDDGSKIEIIKNAQINYKLLQ